MDGDRCTWSLRLAGERGRAPALRGAQGRRSSAEGICQRGSCVFAVMQALVFLQVMEVMSGPGQTWQEEPEEVLLS